MLSVGSSRQRQESGSAGRCSENLHKRPNQAFPKGKDVNY